MLGLLRHARSHYIVPPGAVRLLSTVNTNAHQNRASPTPPPPLNPRSRKHKLDIKPIKVDLSSNTPKATLNAPSSSIEPVKSSPIDIAKEDIQSATAHGILIPPPANASWTRKLLHQGKELFKFYWNGLKLIYANRNLANSIKKRVRDQGIPMTRWETMFVMTNERDLVKLIPFVLILLILEEALPLFVLYAPFLLPSTCLLVSQRNRIISKRTEKQSSLISSSRELLHRIADGQQTDLRTICGLVSLSTYGPSFLKRRRIQSHLQYVQGDDELLLKEASGIPSGIPSNLSHDEIIQVLSERGFDTTYVDATFVKQALDWYYSQPSRRGTLEDRIALIAESALYSRREPLRGAQ